MLTQGTSRLYKTSMVVRGCEIQNTMMPPCSVPAVTGRSATEGSTGSVLSVPMMFRLTSVQTVSIGQLTGTWWAVHGNELAMKGGLSMIRHQ